MALTVGEGAVLSFTKDSVVAKVRPVLEVAVTVSPGPGFCVAPALQVKGVDMWGPPAGVVTVVPVCVKPAAFPVSAGNAVEPSVGVTTLFVRVKLPAATPR